MEQYTTDLFTVQPFTHIHYILSFFCLVNPRPPLSQRATSHSITLSPSVQCGQSSWLVHRQWIPGKVWSFSPSPSTCQLCATAEEGEQKRRMEVWRKGFVSKESYFPYDIMRDENCPVLFDTFVVLLFWRALQKITMEGYSSNTHQV